MRQLVEQVIEQVGEGAERVGVSRSVTGRRPGRMVTVNVRESPLAWLAARGFVSARQAEAGERLRADYEVAQLSARVTMVWAPRIDGGSARGTANEPSARRLSAKRRFDAAVAGLGAGLGDVLWRVVCAGEGLPAAERALGWPVRSGRVVLSLALDRVADRYGLP